MRYEPPTIETLSAAEIMELAGPAQAARSGQRLHELPEQASRGNGLKIGHRR